MLSSLRKVSNEAIETTSHATDLSVHTLDAFESGKQRPSPDALRKLARHHGVDAAALLDAFGYA